MIYDLIIIGAGPAGITASVYAARKGMSFLVISKDIGGQTIVNGEIENYTGYQFITGPELASKFEGHIKKYDSKVKEGEKVLSVEKEDNLVLIKTDKDSYKSKTAIVASGTRWRELGVKGEEEFKNKGLTYCATCDGPLFAQKTVAIVGGGNSGLEAAIQLAKIAKHVYLIETMTSLKGDQILQDKLKKNKKVTILLDSRVTEVLGNKMVNGIKIKTKEQEKSLSLEGIFVEIGLVPNSDFINVEKSNWHEIKINSKNETDIPGIFAAGDVSNIPEKQIIVAAGEGAKATLSAFKYLAHLK